jgi:cytochrome c oxidase cbb3-type subunit 3
MPAWPLVSSYTKGVFGHSQRNIVAEQIEAAQGAQAEFRAALLDKDLADILQDQTLLEFALAGGKAAFGDNCAPCHGSGASGAPGYPNLNDDSWLWGGTLDDIFTTVRYGIRADNDETRVGDMPAFVADEMLDQQQTRDVTEYVLSFSGRSENEAAAKEGAVVFADNCSACHGEDGTGDQTLGAPNLTDDIWLYGGDREAILATVAKGRHGVMPSWEGRLDPVTIKQLVVYVHSLGGGQ